MLQADRELQVKRYNFMLKQDRVANSDTATSTFNFGSDAPTPDPQTFATEDDPLPELLRARAAELRARAAQSRSGASAPSAAAPSNELPGDTAPRDEAAGSTTPGSSANGDGTKGASSTEEA